VAWIAERKDVLSTFFFMLTLMAYTRYAQNKNTLNTQHSTLNYTVAVFFFALGLMSKPMLVTLPFVLLLLDFWPLKLIWNSEFGIRNFTRLLLEKTPFLALAAGSCVVTLLAQEHGHAVLTNLPTALRLQNVAVSYLQYLEKMLWPAPLAAFYPYQVNESATAATAACVLVLISVAVFILRWRRPYLAMGWLWFLGTLVPVIGLVQVGIQGMADRYTYVPLIGLFIALTWGLSDLVSGWRYGPAVLATAAVAALVACLTLSAEQVRCWRNSETLARHALSVTTNNAPMEVLLGNALLAQRKYSEAVQHFAVAARIFPHQSIMQYDLATALAGDGRINEAIAHYRIAVQAGPQEVHPHYALAALLSQQGNFAEAIAEYQTALQLDSNYVPALNDLAWLWATAPEARFRDGVKAVALAEKACRLTNYKLPLLVGTLAAAYAEAGRFDEATKIAEQAIALADAHGNKTLAAKNRQLLVLYQAHQAYYAPASH